MEEVRIARGHEAVGDGAESCGAVGWAGLTHRHRPCMLPQARGEGASSMGIYISSRDRWEITQGFSDSCLVFWGASKKCGVGLVRPDRVCIRACGLGESCRLGPSTARTHTMQRRLCDSAMSIHVTVLSRLLRPGPIHPHPP